MPITIDIKKPLYDSYVYLREDTLNKAIAYRTQVEVKIPGYTRVIDPKEWKDNGTLMSKVFRRPNDPMRLWGGHLKPIEAKPVEDNRQSSLF